ncbi:MAG TPA: NAD(P)-binding domain-containing protein, partial [Minicystis sp.]|nr:NAD(P)-binding domain-containing protein [Minicystis sp.]
MHVGFYGLGKMGAPMAANLVRAGHDVVVFNRTREKATPLVALGAKAAERASDLAAAEVVVTMLADDAALAGAALDGERPGAPFGTGALHVSMSTVSPALSRRLAEAHARAGGGFVAAPVFG